MKMLILIITILFLMAIPISANVVTDIIIVFTLGGTFQRPMANQGFVDSEGNYFVDADGKYFIGATP